MTPNDCYHNERTTQNKFDAASIKVRGPGLAGWGITQGPEGGGLFSGLKAQWVGKAAPRTVCNPSTSHLEVVPVSCVYERYSATT